MNEQGFKDRTKAVGLRVIKVVDSLPNTRAADVIGRQLLGSATSIGANYRAACRGRSAAEMLSKLAIVEEESDETVFWLETLGDCGLVSQRKLASLIDESNQILAMTVASIKTLRKSDRAVVRIKSKIQN